jgi:hypothetical protein
MSLSRVKCKLSRFWLPAVQSCDIVFSARSAQPLDVGLMQMTRITSTEPTYGFSPQTCSLLDATHVLIDGMTRRSGGPKRQTRLAFAPLSSSPGQSMSSSSPSRQSRVARVDGPATPTRARHPDRLSPAVVIYTPSKQRSPGDGLATPAISSQVRARSGGQGQWCATMESGAMPESDDTL